MDDLRARISKLTRDIDKAVEIGDADPPVNGEIAFDMNGFFKLFGCDRTLSAEEIAGIKGKVGKIERLQDFDFAGFRELWILSQHTPADPPASHVPTGNMTAPEPPPAAPAATETTERPVTAPMIGLDFSPLVVSGDSD